MSLRRVFCPDLTPGTNLIPKEEAHHLTHVLRVEAGEEVVLFNGRGLQGRGAIVRADRRGVEVVVEGVVEVPFLPRHRITLAVAFSRAHRQGYLVEKCTELGVAAIWPLLTERSVSRPPGSAVSKWDRRAVEAAKQCGRAWLPEIAPPASMDEVLDRAGEFDITAVADPGGGSISMLTLLGRMAGGGRVLVLVGPEGGWTEAERRRCGERGLVGVSLGPGVLRTETAAVTVCAAAALMSGVNDDQA